MENARNFKYGHGHSMPNNRAKKWYLMYEYEACNFHISARRVQMSDGNYDWNTAKRVRFLQGIANLTKRLSALSSSIGEQTTSTQEFCWVLFFGFAFCYRFCCVHILNFNSISLVWSLLVVCACESQEVFCMILRHWRIDKVISNYNTQSFPSLPLFSTSALPSSRSSSLFALSLNINEFFMLHFLYSLT